MADIRHDLVFAAIVRSAASDYNNIHHDITKGYEFRKQSILDDESLTLDEKSAAIKILTKDYDYDKILFNKGTKRLCENCFLECFATLYCEHCVRTYLKNDFSNWTSGNRDIDDLIQKCQIESLGPNKIIEWIPCNNLQNIKYLTKGGCSEIYSANRIDGRYNKWDSKEQQLKRLGTSKVILKKLENIGRANRSWFEEAKSHLTIGNKHTEIVKCYGLTQDPSDGNYMLVMSSMDIDLRKYLQQCNNQLTWKERTLIGLIIIQALYKIHSANAIHRDLHSGNILYSRTSNYWYISDFGFCGPVDKPLKSIYGSLPYIAPEVIFGENYTFASDIYSMGILMWEISSGYSPFNNCEYNFDLAMKIVNGMRPKIISGTPSEYKKLIKQCWDANPLNRPDINTLYNKLEKIWKDSYNNANEFNTDNLFQIIQSKLSLNPSVSVNHSTSKVYQFENIPEPKNIIKDEDEIYNNPNLHSKEQNDLEIPLVINK